MSKLFDETVQEKNAQAYFDKVEEIYQKLSEKSLEINETSDYFEGQEILLRYLRELTPELNEFERFYLIRKIFEEHQQPIGPWLSAASEFPLVSIPISRAELMEIIANLALKLKLSPMRVEENNTRDKIHEIHKNGKGDMLSILFENTIFSGVEIYRTDQVRWILFFPNSFSGTDKIVECFGLDCLLKRINLDILSVRLFGESQGKDAFRPSTLIYWQNELHPIEDYIADNIDTETFANGEDSLTVETGHYVDDRLLFTRVYRGGKLNGLEEIWSHQPGVLLNSVTWSDGVKDGVEEKWSLFDNEPLVRNFYLRGQKVSEQEFHKAASQGIQSITNIVGDISRLTASYL